MTTTGSSPSRTLAEAVQESSKGISDDKFKDTVENLEDSSSSSSSSLSSHWYVVPIDVDKSKFFDPNYAVLEGDVQSTIVVNDEIVLQRGERCFVMVRRHVNQLHASLVPSSIVQERQKHQQYKPSTTGWLRHELYGLQVLVKLPLGNSDQYGDDRCYLSLNRRGIKCLDLPGEYIGIIDPNDSIIQTTSSRIFSADHEDLLTIQQCELKNRLTRHVHFAKWLISKFGFSRLNSGTGVLDVAGGNGKLSLALHKLGVTQCTILDPKPLCERQPGIDIIAESLERDGSALLNGNHSIKISNCSMIIGLHPDEATEALVDLALRLGKPFAVSPCCVMTKLFPHRKLSRTGDPVRTVHSLCRYLLEDKIVPKSTSTSTATTTIQADFLPFAGRNKVLYWKGIEHEMILQCHEIISHATVTKSNHAASPDAN